MRKIVRYIRFCNVSTLKKQKTSFYQLQQALFEDEKLSLAAKVLYTLLYDRISLSADNKWTDQNGNIYVIYTVEEARDKLGCGRDKAMKVFAELEKFNGTGLIKRIKQGGKKPDRIFIVDIEEAKIETSDKKEVKPTVYHEKDEKLCDYGAIEERKLEVEEIVYKDESKQYMVENPVFEVEKTPYHEVGKTDPINTNSIQTNLIKTNQSEKTDGQNSYANCVKVIKENIEYNYLEQSHPSDEMAYVDSMVNIMAELLCWKPKSGKVNAGGINYSYQEAYNRLSRITGEHINYILEGLKSSSRDIKNMKAYLRACLLNASITIDSHFSRQMQRDRYMDGMIAALEENVPAPAAALPIREEDMPWI